MKHLGVVRSFAGGAIGEPGKRTFYIQVDVEDGRLWFTLEKLQLAAMAERVLEVLRALGSPDRIDPPEIAQPNGVAFRVGEIAIGPADGTFSVVLQPLDPGEGEPVQFDVEHGHLRGMSETALWVVAAGRPLCEFCHLPKDPGDHICPATNGHRGKRLEP